MSDTPLFDFAPESAVPGSPEDAWRHYHEINPHICAGLVRLARLANKRGRSRWSIRAITQVLRWDLETQATDPDSEWKINNNYTAYYARHIMSTYPDLEGFFETRESSADTMGEPEE